MVELRNPLFGPLTAYVPVIAILLTAHYAPQPRPGRIWLTYVAVGALAIKLLSPPGTASVAWFTITDGEIDHLQAAPIGITAFTLLVQLFFLPDYLRLRFSSQYGVFTFPFAVPGNVGFAGLPVSGSTAGKQSPGWS